ncbi:MAG: type VI secretion system tip protein TssI/VgrG [Minicystis sp.]
MSTPSIAAHFSIVGAPHELTVVSLRGREAISELFRFEIEVIGADPSLDFDALLGAAAHLRLTRDSEERHVHGVVAEIALGDAAESAGRYRITLVPRAYLLDLGADCRVFPDASAREILEDLLRARGLRDVRFSLHEAHEPREIVVQYRESDWALLSRLMEAEGIRYLFHHDAETCTLVLSDAPSTHDEIPGRLAIPFQPDPADPGDAIESLDFAQRLRPRRVTLRDYPFDRPLSTVEDHAELDGKLDGKGDAGVYDFPGIQAQKRLQALQATHRIARGSARSIRLAPGATFELEGHPRAALNARWLLTAVEHEGSFGEGDWAYHARFEAIPASVPFRPEAKTPRPRILGAQTATVVGPTHTGSGVPSGAENAEIHSDDQGRVLVQFHWDRGREKERTACWLPVAQYTASRGYGAVHLPRVGDAVLVEFLDGDPDRPIVAGSVYHKVNTPPYALPKGRSKAVFRDASTPGGHGHNELSFDCSAGAEEVFLRAQRNSRVQVKHDATRAVGHDDTLSVAHDQAEKISGARTTTVGKDDMISVSGSRVETIDIDQTISVAGDRKLLVAGDLQDVIAGDRTVVVESSDELVVVGDRAQIIEGSRSASIAGNDSTNIGGNRAESVEGNQQLLVSGTTFETHGALQVAVTGATSFKGSGEVLVESETIQKIGAPKVYISAGSQLFLRAKESITLQVGDAKITIEDGHVYLTCGNTHKTLAGDTLKLNC